MTEFLCERSVVAAIGLANARAAWIVATWVVQNAVADGVIEAGRAHTATCDRDTNPSSPTSNDSAQLIFRGKR